MGLDAYYGGGPVTPLPLQVPASAPQVTPVAANAPAANTASPAASPSSSTPTTTAPAPGSTAQPAASQTQQGIAQFVVKNGDSFWALLRNQNIVDKNALSDDALLQQNLAATPWLDPNAFGARSGNGACSLTDMPVGATVTVLDPQRLQFLNEQRQALADAPGLSSVLSGPQAKELSTQERAQMLAPIVKPIVDELNYALLKNGVVSDADVDAAAKTISERAPGDRAFQQALALAKAQVLTTRDSDGRTPGQVGKLQQDAASGNVDALKQDMRAQLMTVAQAALKDSDGDSAQAFAAITQRLGVYQTYFGATNGALVKDVAQDVQQQVLVKDPVQSVLDAYNDGLKKGGTREASAAAAAQLQAVTDPKKKMPGQVAAIMKTLMNTPMNSSDGKPALKTIVDGLADGMSSVYGDDKTFKTMNALSAALQHTYDSDPPKQPGDKSTAPGPGQTLVNELTAYLIQTFKSRQDVQQVVNTNPNTFVELLQSSVQNDGDVALAASIAAQSNTSGDKLYTNIAESAIATGLDGYRAKSLEPLGAKTGKDALAYTQGPKEFGNANTPEQAEKALAALKDVPGGADVFTDMAASADAAERLQNMKKTLDSYAGDMHGAGFDKPAEASPWWGAQSHDVTDALQQAMKAVPPHPAPGSAPDTEQTQWWWQARVMTGVLSFSSKQVAQVFTTPQPGGKPSSTFENVFGDEQYGTAGRATIAKNGLLGGLFMLNGAAVVNSLASSPSNDNLANVDNAGFAALYSGIGVSMSLDALAPGWKKQFFDTTAKGDAATLQRKMLDTLLQKIDGWETKDLTKTVFKNSARTLLSSTSDVAAFALAEGGLIPLFTDPSTNPGHEFAFALAGVSDLGSAFAKQAIKTAAERVLESAGQNAAEAAGKQMIWGLAEDGWTGVGLAGNFVATAAQYMANQYDLAHVGDKGVTAYLLALGVKPEVAEPFARHATTVMSSESAGPAMSAYFRALGKGTPEMVEWMNKIPSGRMADLIATHLKPIEPGKDKDGHYVLSESQVTDIQNYLKLIKAPLS